MLSLCIFMLVCEIFKLVETLCFSRLECISPLLEYVCMYLYASDYGFGKVNYVLFFIELSFELRQVVKYILRRDATEIFKIQVNHSSHIS